jgi:uncharacterized membrane protein/thiol-disulfide isomerase/thioredoxin
MKRLAYLLLLTSILLSGNFFPAHAQESKVRVVLFYSPTCGHCHKVITEDLPPILDEYGGEPNINFLPPAPEEEELGPGLVHFEGEKLEILYVNVQTSAGGGMYSEYLEIYQIPDNRLGVPALIIGENVLVGDQEIPAQLPNLIETHLEAGGLTWPDLPSIPIALELMVVAPQDDTGEIENQEAELDSAPEAVQIVEDEVFVQPDPAAMTMRERFNLDPQGNTIALIVLIGMLFSTHYAVMRLKYKPIASDANWKEWIILIFSVAGLGVAGYLTYIESTGSLAVCGPVGNCNAVQQSQYARLFGVLPIAVLGLAGYLGILGAWIIARSRNNVWSDWSRLAIFAMSVFGVLFSIYLTVLEPFVIGASCAWCLTSAVLITAVMLLSLDKASPVLERIWKAD